MRSRYTAFVCERADYLQATWHAPAPARPRSTLMRAPNGSTDVRRYAITDADHAVVEFVARYRVAGCQACTKPAAAVREGGRWFYVDGDCILKSSQNHPQALVQHAPIAMKFEAILFDCDGVLVDSEPITNGVLRDMLAEAGWVLTPEECMRLFIGEDGARSEAAH